jgi:hypothetical protein
MDSNLSLRIKKRIYLHPRLQLQKLPMASMDTVLSKMPGIIPFPGKEYTSLMLIMDWDHKIPSRRILGRLLAFYSTIDEQRALRDYKYRFEEIKKNSMYPEFNVSDYDDIYGNESYIYIFLPDGRFRKVHFISPWGRTFQESEKQIAMEVVKRSSTYLELKEKYGFKCGPLKVLSWVPPCANDLKKWTIDVRYITYCEPKSVWGKTFLVDPIGKELLSISNFNSRV